ncbi:MAG: hypothetical protein ACF8MJ_11325 [Phycisphaerales bacterium JB050]
MAVPDESDPAKVSPFERDAVEAISLARDAYSKIIEHKCPGSKAVSAVADTLGIHRKLAWQLIKVAYSEDPFVAAKHMPSTRSVEALSKAAKRQGVDDSLVRAIHGANARFQSLISTHAADKAEFDMLVDSHCSDGEHQDDERWRQHSYEGNSFTWGAHCKTLLAMCIMVPSLERERHFHMVQVRGLMGFRQTRPGVRWVVNQSVAVDDEKRPESGMRREALDPVAAEAHNGVPVLPEYCSDPVPELGRTPTPDGMMQDEFVSGQVGLQGERTLVTAEILRNIAPTHATEYDKTAHFGSSVRTPTEMLHFDLFVHAGLFGDVKRELCVFSDVASSIAFGESDELFVREKISLLGRGLSMTHAPDLPGYHDLASDVFARLALNPEDYELYRIRIAYPPFPATIMVRHPLLPKDQIQPV